MQFYPWLVFVHLLGVVLFAAAHGVSMWAAFAIRRSRDPRVVAELLALSQRAIAPLYAGLLLIGIGGLGAAWVADLLVARWVVGSYVVLAVVLLTMWVVASPYYMGLRKVIGGARPTDEPAVEALLRSRRPDVLLAVGVVGLVVLVWLMVVKPG